MKLTRQTFSFIFTSLAIGIYSACAIGICTTLPSSAETNVGGSQNPKAQSLFDSANKKMSSKDYAGALADLNQAIAIDPKYGKAIANRAAARFNLHDYKGAIADLDVALKFFPNMPFLEDLRAKSVHAMEAPAAAANQPEINRRQANNLLMQAMLGGDLADPSTQLMMQAQRAGLMNGGGARRQVVNPFAAHPLVSNQQVDLTPGVTAEIKASGDGNMSTTNESSRLAAMMQSTPGSAEPQSKTSSTSKQGDNQQSFQDQQNSTSNPSDNHSASNASDAGNPLSAQEYYDRGCQKSLKMDFAGAIGDFDHSIALNPKFGDAWANRGLARLKTKDFKGALKDFEEADRLVPNNQQLKQLIELATQLSK